MHYFSKTSFRSLLLAVLLFTVLLNASVHSALADPAASQVNINHATAQELAAALSGIGEARAQAIVSHREANGGFATVDDLVLVSGIGPGTLAANRDRMTVDAPAEAAD